MRILIVDDDKWISGVLRTHCKLMGYELTICDDPIKTLELIKTEKLPSGKTSATTINFF